MFCIIEYPSLNAKCNKQPLKKFFWKRFMKHIEFCEANKLGFLSKVMFKSTKSGHFKTRYRGDYEFIIINQVKLWNFIFTFCSR